jgi:hypothetical protein
LRVIEKFSRCCSPGFAWKHSAALPLGCLVWQTLLAVTFTLRAFSPLRLRWRASGLMIAKPISIKLTGGKSGGCASKAVELTSGDLRHVTKPASYFRSCAFSACCNPNSERGLRGLRSRSARNTLSALAASPLIRIADRSFAYFIPNETNGNSKELIETALAESKGGCWAEGCGCQARNSPVHVTFENQTVKIEKRTLR